MPPSALQYAPFYNSKRRLSQCKRRRFAWALKCRWIDTDKIPLEYFLSDRHLCPSLGQSLQMEFCISFSPSEPQYDFTNLSIDDQAYMLEVYQEDVFMMNEGAVAKVVGSK